jgi:hypothetical protein
MISLRFHRHSYLFPATEEPSWKHLVDRWYQLDAFAYGLADAASRWQEKTRRPGLLILASPGASNESDFRFASTGASSPSKFVHTLPNVRASSLCQVMNWTGPLLCLQNDPHTCQTALKEAVLFSSDHCPLIWVAGVRRLSEGIYESYLFECSYSTSEEAPSLKFPWEELLEDETLFSRMVTETSMNYVCQHEGSHE